MWRIMKRTRLVGLLVLGTMAFTILLSFSGNFSFSAPVQAQGNHASIAEPIHTSGPQIVITGDAEMDTFFSGNATSGTSHSDAYLLENMIFTSVNNDGIIKITDTTRYLHIKNCTFTNEENAYSTSHGVMLDNVSNIWIENCTIIGFNQENQNGVYLTQSVNVTINASYFLLNRHGINLNIGNSLITVKDNIIYNSTYRGIRSSWNSQVEIYRNDIRFNFLGIWIAYDDNFEITNNTFKDNSGGITCGTGCSVNFIWNNYFKNTNNAYDSDETNSNFWDNSTWGNYWSDYILDNPTATNDGTYWDTRYIITEYYSSIYDNCPVVACTFPLVDFTANKRKIEVNQSVSFQFTGILGFGNPGFNWSFGDGISSNATNPTHVYSEVGTYDVTLTLEDADGDVRTFTLEGYIQVTGPGADLPVPWGILYVIIGTSAGAAVLVIVLLVQKRGKREV